MANDAAWLRQVFERQLPLAGFAPREEQQAMAGYVQTALLRDRHLLAEAGVGTGKTFAYLIPLLAFMRERQTPVLIATHTIALQEQLVERDIPALSRLLAIPASATLAKGRDHFLCKERLAGLRARRPQPNADEAQLLDWGQRTMTGDRAQAPAVLEALWGQVSWSDGGPCARSCRQAATCPAAGVRRRWLHADGFLVTNHHQLMADLAARAAGRAFLALPGAVVIDEAQELPGAARQILGERLRLAGLSRLLHEALAQAGPRARVGPGWLASVQAFEGRLAGQIQWQADDEVERFALEPDARLQADTRALVEGGRKVLACLEADSRAGRQELATRLGHALGALGALVAPERHVVWVEGEAMTRRPHWLVSSPRDPGALLRERLWSRPSPAILTSATLAAGDDFGPLRRELGLDQTQPLICAVGSPFDYEQQARLYLPDDLPDPGQDADGFYLAASERLAELLRVTRGRALVLFTSKRRMAQAATRLQQACAVPVLVQDRARPEVLARFIAEPSAVLLSTGYWTGLDVPGETLSCLVVVKLPFPPPEPLITARQQAARAAGLDPVADVLVSEMLVRLKQGAGRAIRASTDRAVIAVLDPRAVTRFGESVAMSLPPAPAVALGAVSSFLDGADRE